MAVIGDGKLGLLVAQALVVLKEVEQLTHFGRHQEKLRLICGSQQVVVTGETKTKHDQVSMKEGLWLANCCTCHNWFACTGKYLSVKMWLDCLPTRVQCQAAVLDFVSQ